MTKSNEEIYAELKDDVAAVANPLFDLSERLLRELGNFLPHGYALVDEGEDKMVGAEPGSPNGMSTSTEILPLLHEGLRVAVREGKVRAIGIAENVSVTLKDGVATRAIKVLVEHERGLCVALYRPFKKHMFGSFSFGTTFTAAASPEVQPQWPMSDAEQLIKHFCHKRETNGV